jgi:hypothetical protein
VVEALRAFQEGADSQAALARALRRRELSGEELLAFIEGRLARR